ncbi:hypothetical protein JCM6292_2645 [Bacteroides pyogenes JCM 6292]|uniref:Uncharacterized protein n=2 Tax=Bacteroides pyogenes TaxID=310300 RepID=W4PJP5_9BACE|nr:hypothetical protein [Bacteroides pyogenes]GAE16243.1 hypothetical protein JCM6292_2645 [Bacteroides pyogenes JCM 6292]GAE19648.1 hypothetical protein JCM6294_2729 [Bacteroides pyogenes DSM 20611 = JCM 6294]
MTEKKPAGFEKNTAAFFKKAAGFEIKGGGLFFEAQQSLRTSIAAIFSGRHIEYYPVAETSP